MLGRSGPDAVDDETQRLDLRGAALAQLIGRTQGAVGCGDGEEARLGDDGYPAARRPGGAGEPVEARRAVDEDEPVALRDAAERILETTQVALRERGAVELGGPRGAGDDIEVTHLVADPPRGDDRLREDLLRLRRREDVGDVDLRRGRHIESRRRVGLRVHVDDERRDAAVVGRRGETESHRRLADAALETADTEDKHPPTVTYPPSSGRSDHAEEGVPTRSGTPCIPWHRSLSRVVSRQPVDASRLRDRYRSE